jgi:6-phosphogluconolactonase (cycloisomerase 2 family)
VTIPRRDFLLSVAGIAAAARVEGLAAQEARSFMYVGSFTAPDRGHGDGISVFQRTGTGRWMQIQSVKDLENPSFLVTNRQGRHLYAVHGDGDLASAYRIDPTTGRLALIAHQATGGKNGVHLAIDASGTALVVANYASGTLAVLPINADGSLAALSDLATLPGMPGPHRIQQPSSYPHHCPFDPTGRFIVVPDKGLDKVFVFRLDPAAGKLTPNDPPWVTTRAGAGPRHVDFHRTRPYAYVLNELDSSMTTYQFDSGRGELKPIQIVPTTPDTYTGNNTAAEIAVARSGRFVYASNRGHNSIAIFGIDAASGRLTPVGWEPTQGLTPRYFGLDPAGATLYVANQESDTVVAFRVNERTGRLTPTGETLGTRTPCTIAFR